MCDTPVGIRFGFGAVPVVDDPCVICGDMVRVERGDGNAVALRVLIPRDGLRVGPGELVPRPPSMVGLPMVHDDVREVRPQRGKDSHPRPPLGVLPTPTRHEDVVVPAEP